MVLTTDRNPVFSIGHSNHPIGHFISLLQRHGIERLADVRSTPFSRFNPQFNRARLEESLRGHGIRYEFLGTELGARSTDPGCYEHGRVSYARLAASPTFKRGLDALRAGSDQGRVAIMCAEREPLDCHRTILVARELERARVPVFHILADGALEENGHALQRLVERLSLRADDLFRDSAELFDAAYDAQGAKIAYVPKNATAPGTRSPRK